MWFEDTEQIAAALETIFSGFSLAVPVLVDIENGEEHALPQVYFEAENRGEREFHIRNWLEDNFYTDVEFRLEIEHQLLPEHVFPRWHIRRTSSGWELY